MLRTQASSLLRAAPRLQQTMVLRRAATTHAISNPTLANIEKRWETMPLQEQAELWMALRDRMKGSWSELTLQEKKAGTFSSALVDFSTCTSTGDLGFRGGSGFCIVGRLRPPSSRIALQFNEW